MELIIIFVSEKMYQLIPYISLSGLFLPLLILFYNRGFKSANRYLAGFLFFSSLYLLESFTFFYAESKSWVAFFTNTHTFYYLIGPFAFFYVRSMLRDNSRISKVDWLHFLPFVTAFIGFIPYLCSAWSYKLLVADNIQSDNWDMEQFHLNFIIPHKVDQALNVLQIYFYSIALWILLSKYKRNSNSRIYQVPQFKLIRNWLFIFTLIITIITINFTVAMANMWLYDNKYVFLEKASGALLFASIVYVGMNMIVMIFPHIMYGLPLDVKDSFFTKELDESDDILNKSLVNDSNEENSTAEVTLNNKKDSPLLFSSDYIEKIELAILEVISNEDYLLPDFKLINIADKFALPAHHLTYYFNAILNQSFSDWKNKLRVEYAITLLNQGHSSSITLEAISLKSGFTAQNTFIRAFKLHTGQTPSEYSKKIALQP